MKVRLFSMALAIGVLAFAATGPPVYAADQDCYFKTESAKITDSDSSIDAPTLDAATPAADLGSGTLVQFSAIYHDMGADLPSPLTVTRSHDADIDRCAPIPLKISEVMADADHRAAGRTSRLALIGHMDYSDSRARPPDDTLLGLERQLPRVYRI
jgi:hypothetical protein